MESGGKREFSFAKSTGKKYGIPWSSLKRYIPELKDHKFITCTADNHTTRQPNQYAFVPDWKPP